MDTDVPPDHSTMRNDCVFMATLHVLPGAIKCAVVGMGTPFLTSAEQYSNSEPRRPQRTGNFECIIMIYYISTIYQHGFLAYMYCCCYCCLKKNQNAPRPSEHPPVMGKKWQLFLTFSVLVANPKKLLYTMANPARGLLNREKITKEKVWQHTPTPTPPHCSFGENR